MSRSSPVIDSVPLHSHSPGPMRNLLSLKSIHIWGLPNHGRTSWSFLRTHWHLVSGICTPNPSSSNRIESRKEWPSQALDSRNWNGPHKTYLKLDGNRRVYTAPWFWHRRVATVRFRFLGILLIQGLVSYWQAYHIVLGILATSHYSGHSFSASWWEHQLITLRSIGRCQPMSMSYVVSIHVNPFVRKTDQWISLQVLYNKMWQVEWKRIYKKLQHDVNCTIFLALLRCTRCVSTSFRSNVSLILGFGREQS